MGHDIVREMTPMIIADLTEEEKEQRIKNVYRIAGGGNANDSSQKTKNREKPREVAQFGVKEIIRDDNTTVLETADKIAAYFRFDIWYHGSPLELTELSAGSIVTRWRKLAEVFSHKPDMLSYDKVGGSIRHNGQIDGFLYVVDEPVIEGVDIYKHPNTTMDEGVEWLTKRPLKIRKICKTKKP